MNIETVDKLANAKRIKLTIIRREDYDMSLSIYGPKRPRDGGRLWLGFVFLPGKSALWGSTTGYEWSPGAGWADEAKRNFTTEQEALDFVATTYALEYRAFLNR